ncbi:hypothetical protein AB6E21_01660 [Photobacterium swingsii]|uniref:hypothetical protein n=1 Tax=Photobacterium swingsii TaxID=680026 RepID=UPI003550EFB9
MNPLSYTLHTLNAKQLLVEPEVTDVLTNKGQSNDGIYLVVFMIGVVLGSML